MPSNMQPHHRLRKRRRRKWKSKTKKNLTKRRKSVQVLQRRTLTRRLSKSEGYTVKCGAISVALCVD